MIRTHPFMIFSLIAAVLLSVPSVAEEPAPQLFIERIEVRNHNRVSPEVVIAESRLREGRPYTELELRDASTRLSRLPFLLSVDFSLEKGSERGRHVLVLTIHETKPFFFFADARQFFPATAGANGPDINIDYNDRLSATGNTLALGYRWFVGSRGAVHVGFTAGGRDSELRRDYASLAVGYTQYDLLGTRAFATLNIKRPIEGYGRGAITPEIVVGIPLSGNQTVTLQYDETHFDRDPFEVDGVKVDRGRSERLVSARWSYNTTNDPHLPTRGTLLQLGPTITWIDTGEFFQTPPDGTPAAVSTETTIYGVEASAAHHWELNDRDSVFGDLRGEWGRRESTTHFTTPVIEDSNVRYGSVGVGYGRSLWSREQRAHGDSRLEATVRYSHRSRRESELYVPGRGYAPEGTRQVSAAWVRRSSWGTLRLGAGYAW